MAVSGLCFVGNFVSDSAIVAMNCFVFPFCCAVRPLPPLCAHAGAGRLTRCHRTCDQFVAFLQVALEDLGDLCDSVVGDSGADSNGLESAIRMQLPQDRNIKPWCSCWRALG